MSTNLYVLNDNNHPLIRYPKFVIVNPPVYHPSPRPTITLPSQSPRLNYSHVVKMYLSQLDYSPTRISPCHNQSEDRKLLALRYRVGRYRSDRR